jgi:hypothetical protein
VPLDSIPHIPEKSDNLKEKTSRDPELVAQSENDPQHEQEKPPEN